MQNIHLGAFHDVVAIGADDDYVSILDHTGLEFLIPTYPARGLNHIPFTGKFGSLATATGPLHLDHLTIKNVTHIAASPSELIISTRPGHNFSWKVYRS